MKLFSAKNFTLAIVIILFSAVFQPVVTAQKGNSHAETLKSPGKIFFLSTRDGNWEIYAMDTSGMHQVNLSNHPQMDYWITCHPATGHIYFYSNRDGDLDIYAMGLDGQHQKRITDDPAADSNPQVSPDGRKILFQSNRDEETTEIYLMNADGTNVTRLTHNKAYEDVAAWSPDGKTIVYSRDAQEMTTEENSDGDYELFVMKLNGGKEKKLTDFAGFVSGPAFSPDGKRIAFYGRGSDGNLDLFTIKNNGSGLINITNDMLEQYSPSWSPDGTWIAYTGGDKSNYDIWIIHLKTGQRIRLTTEAKRDESPVWVK